MTYLRAFLVLPLLAVLPVACGGGGAGSDSDFADRFTAACLESSNWPESLCECMADRAVEELSEDARELLLASLQGDDEKVAEARADLGVTEAMEAGLFMTDVGSCAQFIEGAG